MISIFSPWPYLSRLPIKPEKHKANFEEINGFWHSIDNYKDIDDLNERKNKIKYNSIKKISRKIKK